MKTTASFLAGTVLLLALPSSQARVVTVTTADNADPPAGQTSLLQALTNLQDGDEIHFQIPGEGPHFIATPPGGYPLITRNNVVIDGYTQPGSAPNTNPILAANNARLQIVLDSRNGEVRLLDFPPSSPNDLTGYGPNAGAVLGVLGAQGFTVRGLGLLALPFTGPGSGVEVHGVVLARGASGQVRGCWIGVAPDGTTLAGPNKGVTGLRYQQRDENLQVTGNLLVNDVVIGVPPASATPEADFNLLTGIPAVPVVLEGHGARISGNFLGVQPDGLHDVNLALDPAFSGSFGGFIRIGYGANGTVIGTDGDGVNDGQERNIIGGSLPPLYGGAAASIAFYDPDLGTNIVVAGNYFGVGVDGQTTFTNGVPALSVPGSLARVRFGSNLDGLSDAAEGNLVFNHWPDTVFSLDYFDFLLPNDLNFFHGLVAGSLVSLRGNTLVNNLPFPSSPTRLDEGVPGAWLANYYAGVLADPAAGVYPTIATNSTARRLRGTVPLADTTGFPVTLMDIYLADPEGMATGEAVQITELPHGFVQGRTYLRSFVENGPADLDPVPGRFDFDLAALALTEAVLTITANYASAAVTAPSTAVLTSPFSDPVRVTGGPVDELRFTAVTRLPAGVQLEWTGGGTLEASPRLTDGWQDVPGATSPHLVPVSDPVRFFRLRR
jgi:hypothetical protein